MKSFFSTHNLKGDYLSVSPEITNMLGYSTEEIIGKSAYEFFHADDLKRIMFSHLNLDEGLQETVYRFRVKDNTFVWVKTFSSKIKSCPDCALQKEFIGCFTFELTTWEIFKTIVSNTFSSNK